MLMSPRSFVDCSLWWLVNKECQVKNALFHAIVKKVGYVEVVGNGKIVGIEKVTDCW